MEKIILPVILFVLTMTITPGPNNMLLTASGAQFGFKRSLPFIIGIVLGILSQLLLSALGLGILFNRFPIIQNILKISGSLYILFLAIKIAFPRSDKSDETQKNRPMSLLQGAAFQYLNPKAYSNYSHDT
jgi:threonine/homoserine/homoserine lactone efflux protein